MSQHKNAALGCWFAGWTLATIGFDAIWLLGYLPSGRGLGGQLHTALFLVPFNGVVLFGMLRLAAGHFPDWWFESERCLRAYAATLIAGMVLSAGAGIAAVAIGHIYFVSHELGADPPTGVMVAVYAGLLLLSSAVWVAIYRDKTFPSA